MRAGRRCGDSHAAERTGARPSRTPRCRNRTTRTDPRGGRDEARRLLTADAVPACTICHPDTQLHIID
ncbi:DUF6233 domain-containing protein [Streptomyces shenzhenensis]|uniref:DUF6233 domain-containing protein n=1 Tax=Streptomyces shenzhenensis TaxID=943815 RepID=UPI001F46C6FF|nr:DUF6233 domain-containing protein [Streptomyces shenzhenensis]